MKKIFVIVFLFAVLALNETAFAQQSVPTSIPFPKIGIDIGHFG